MYKSKLLQKLGQKQLLTQKQIQALHIIQMPLSKLEEEVNNLILENVFLKIEKNDMELYSLDRMEYITEQISEKISYIEKIKPIFLAIIPDHLEKAGEEILNYIDNKGILSVTKKELFKKLKISKKDLNLLLYTLKELGPTGFAEESLEKAIELRKKSGEMGLPLSSLENLDNISYINSSPDIIFYKKGNKIIWEINIPELPEVDEIYLNNLKKLNDRKTQKYIEKEMEKLSLLKSSLKKRKEYMEILAQFIIDTNNEFLLKNINPRKFGIREVANHLNISPSTMSRIVSTKYFMNTNNIIFPFSVIFNTKDSQKNTRKIIFDFIKKHMNLSDSKISSLLNSELNIKVSRRTINKYKNLIKRGEDN
ncbi:DNA-directed RNA polymerase specialized sigma subunit, sigma24 [Marinitoga piezophila KA3]|uniref:DNA-directed RNA polymerase specialized sigma subunit, sigma24 n=1 Tax=Marinitoga piezophila (strain DSM 14283 / JCM 11233 / KA3) TaxID=443254 RepID=H2J605_MARPK|nr:MULTISPECIES: DNA-directed RNA polymerase subunit sigma-24 [Marinitoga]AEX85066.1 DNA-directed RNA polymerase specialized sigma subunit, sigma24 [Marinitoga piezophila KA3]APT75574.1 hypothetical protein LN42_03585 [Marinitoga sp. 1137]NUU97216.1 hypothetical protein [Marinitoga sp. 1138]